MFDKQIYKQRREKLRGKLKGGVALILGNTDVPMNYADNAYRFRQDSNFLYFFGLDQQNLAGVIDLESGEDILFGDDFTLDDIVWMGPQPTLAERAGKAGVERTQEFGKLHDLLAQVMKAGRKIHFLPPYRGENMILLEKLLGIKPDQQQAKSSADLIRAVVALRCVKDEGEVREIEKAVDTTALMHTTAMKMAYPGVYEYEIAGVVEGIALSGGGRLAYPLILSIHGETLHNHSHHNKLREGRMVIMDGGAESEMHYAADITRTFPVGGKFSQRQRDIYEIVLKAKQEATRAIKPGIPFRDIHMLSAGVIAEGLSSLGIMKGDTRQAVEQGAHALFMPHGLGHMMGLDVHDMEDLGEDYVGYDDEIKRSDIFGTKALRFGRKLEPGFVLTVEPGIYFIPELVDRWEQEGRFREFINYEKVRTYLDFGGARLEDNILVTDDGFRVLGRPIPDSPDDVEKMMEAGR